MRCRAFIAASFGFAAGLLASSAFAAPVIASARPVLSVMNPDSALVLNADGRVVSVSTLDTPGRRFELTPTVNGATTTQVFAYESTAVTMAGHWANTVPSASAYAPYQLGHMVPSLRDVRLSARLMPSVNLDLAQGADSTAPANPFDLRNGGYDGLFLSGAALRSPYMAVADGGTYAGLTLSMGDNIRLHAGQANLPAANLSDPQLTGLSALPPDLALRIGSGARSATATSGTLELNLTDWAGLAMSASRSTTNGALQGTGASSAVNGLDTNALGISARVGFGAGWVTTMSYNEGVSHLNLARSDLLSQGGSLLKSRAYGIAIAKEGVFGDDALGIAVSRPLQVYSGGADFTSAIDEQGRLVFGKQRSEFTGSAPESDIELGYVTTFLDGALALQANASYQVNAGGERGSDAVSVLSRAKINF